MGVPDRADPVRGGGCGRGKHLGEPGPGPPGGAVHVLEVDRVERPVHRAQDLPAALRVGRQLGHQLPQHLQVDDQPPYVLVEHGEVHAPERVLRFVARRLRVAERGGQEAGDDGVGGGLDVQAHLLAAPGGGADADPGGARVEPLHRGAVRPVHQALALEAGHVLVEAEVEERFDGPPGPCLGHGAGHPEPAGAPRRTPPSARLDRLGFSGQALGDRYGFAGRVPDRDLQRNGLGIHGGTDALVEHPPEAGLDQAGVVMHESGSVGWADSGAARRGPQRVRESGRSPSDVPSPGSSCPVPGRGALGPRSAGLPSPSSGRAPPGCRSPGPFRFCRTESRIVRPWATRPPLSRRVRRHRSER